MRFLTRNTCLFPSIDGLSLFNEDGGLRVFFPNNSFVTNSTLTRTAYPRTGGGNDHIVCYGGDPNAAQVTWYNSSGGPLQICRSNGTGPPVHCGVCGFICMNNSGVGLDPPLYGQTNIHIYTGSDAYVNQVLECRVSGGQSAFIGLFLKNGGG